MAGVGFSGPGVFAEARFVVQPSIRAETVRFVRLEPDAAWQPTLSSDRCLAAQNQERGTAICCE